MLLQLSLNAYLNLNRAQQNCLSLYSIDISHPEAYAFLRFSWGPRIVSSLDKLPNSVKPNVTRILGAAAASDQTCSAVLPAPSPDQQPCPDPNLGG